jgi:acyl-CoA synthetase (AMP-forming)/AMP-acid ligase II
MIFRSRFPALDIPSQSLTPFVLERAAEHADKPAIVSATTGEGYTYGELRDRVDGLAHGLTAGGLAKGDVVALLSPNRPEFALAFLAVLSAGGVVTTLNPLLTVHEVGHQLRDSGARFAIAVREHADKLRTASDGLDAKLQAVWEIEHDLDGLIAPGEPPAVNIDPDRDLAALPYSSGTTGLSKGVMLTHRNLVANVLQTAAGQGVEHDDTVAAVLPFFHIYGMTVTMNYCLWRGATVVCFERYDRETFPERLEHFGVTRLYAVPPIILDLAKRDDLDRFDLTRLRRVLSGAAPLDAELASAATQRLSCRVTQGYGLTETSPCTHLTPLDDDDAPPASVGPALPDTECKIVDPVSETELGPGERGELWIRGPQVMRGYLRNPEATAGVIDEQGFLHTGDVAIIDDNGYCFIVDRLKELIKYKGYQIAPAELEAVLLSHPAIADAAVIGVPDTEAGEHPKGFVVCKRPVDDDEVLGYVASRVAPYKRLREVEFVESIPKSASGKILRRQLREPRDSVPASSPPEPAAASAD